MKSLTSQIPNDKTENLPRERW